MFKHGVQFPLNGNLHLCLNFKERQYRLNQFNKESFAYMHVRLGTRPGKSCPKESFAYVCICLFEDLFKIQQFVCPLQGRKESNVDLDTDTSLVVEISDALSERDKVKFTVHTKVRTPYFPKDSVYI